MFLPADRGGVGVSTFWMTWVCEKKLTFSILVKYLAVRNSSI